MQTLLQYIVCDHGEHGGNMERVNMVAIVCKHDGNIESVNMIAV